MKKGYRTTAAILTAALMMSAAAGCTKKTAVDGTSDPSASDSAQSPVESAGSELPGDIIDTVPTDFDIHDYTFDTVYGSQLPEYVERQYYFNGEEVPIAESNFYFVNAFLELTEYASYGYYPVTEDNFLDLSAAIDYGDDEQGEFETYGDLFNQYSERMLASTCTICKLAREQGLSIGDEFLQVEWLTRELWQDEYKVVRETLEKSVSIRECSDVLVKVYLRPADQSEAVRKQRAALGREFYQKFSQAEAEGRDGIPDDEAGLVAITEEEFRTYSRAVLVVMTLRDLLQAMDEFKNE